MGWFDEQIKQRRQRDQERFEEAFIDLASVVQGDEVFRGKFESDQKRAKSAVDEILKFYRCRADAVQTDGTIEEEIERRLVPAGVMRRRVRLKDDWYRTGISALIVWRKDGGIVPALPRGNGYRYLDYEAGRWRRITEKNVYSFSEDALCFYRPLPLKPLGVKELLRFCLQTLTGLEYIRLLLAFLAITLIGMVLPAVNEKMFSEFLPEENRLMLAAAAAALLGTTVAAALFRVVRSLMVSGISVKWGISVNAALMARVMALPTEFFKNYSSGELYSRMDSVGEAVKKIADTVLQIVLTALCSLLYLIQIARFAPELLGVSAAAAAVLAAMIALAVCVQAGIYRERLYRRSKTAGREFDLYSGVQKLKLAGAEKRAFANWAGVYKNQAQVTYNPPLYIRIFPGLCQFVLALGWILIFAEALRTGTDSGAFMAYNTAFLILAGAFLDGAKITGEMGEMFGALLMVRPILETVPESSGNKEIVSKLTGNIELSHVSFRYQENTPYIINDLSLKIRPGQYVAIVGKTGCGKSTLLRLLLGFENPQKGAVYYDRKDLRKLDLRSVRRKIGTVMQDSELFNGDILSNITISAPWLGVKEAEEAARIAGMQEDIEELPMGMFTVIGEGGAFSGGQKQRLLIARAVVAKPKVLIFDEATSALDNITQKQVAEALGAMKCTRIVIAHRLSTIRDCDRILVLDNGKIVEDGKYDRLIKKDGIFAELVRRQQVEKL